MDKAVRRFAAPGVAALIGVALDLSGYQNGTLAIVLLVGAGVWSAVASVFYLAEAAQRWKSRRPSTPEPLKPFPRDPKRDYRALPRIKLDGAGASRSLTATLWSIGDGLAA